MCSMHGGKAPQVRETARERLAALAEPAIDALKRALEAEDINAMIRAAQLILDRTGFGPTKTITGENGEPLKFTMDLGDSPITCIRRIIVGPVDRYLPWVPADRIAVMREWMAEAMTAEAEKRPPLHDDTSLLTESNAR